MRTSSKQEVLNAGSEKEWYAFYTSPRAEKKVAKRFEEQDIEHYLPLIKTLKQWSDRKKIVIKPLINSYIFVKTHRHFLQDVLSIPGVIRYISFEGQPATIPDYQIDILRLLVSGESDIKISSGRLSAGDKVEIIYGTLCGIRGELVRISGNSFVVVRIDKLDLNLSVTIQQSFLKKISQG